MKKKFQPFSLELKKIKIFGKDVFNTGSVLYHVGTVDAGSCLYAHIVICNIINDIISLRITSVSSSQVCTGWMPFLPPQRCWLASRKGIWPVKTQW